jgi:penicillin-binding protein 1B
MPPKRKINKPRKAAPAKARRKSAGPRRNAGRAPWRRYALRTMAVLAVVMVAYVVYLDFSVRHHFEGKRWSLPARVFARPLELFEGQALNAASLQRELELLRYRRVVGQQSPGEYRRDGNHFTLHTRGFAFAADHEPAHVLTLAIDDGRVVALRDAVTGAEVSLARIEPLLIANIYPTHNEDRLLVKLEDVPQLLIDGLIAVEDRQFYEHIGVSPASIARAAMANLRAGRTVQGGSTITQQLVKNFYLSNERTLTRKANEAVMALLLEWHYDKNAILEAYLNEIYLGQDGARSIHGFGLASEFYFQRRLDQLEKHQLALLVAIVKGASYYDPRRHPERARQRRDLVLDLLHAQGHLSDAELAAAKGRGLDVVPSPPSGVTPFPAYLDVVREQLRRDYHEDDLRSEGLFIFTNMDPAVQVTAEDALTRRLPQLERGRGLPGNSLQGAMVVTAAEQGEIVAVVGDRDPRYAGFNRALNAHRPIGSLIKPAVYLTALSRPDDYTLMTQVDDGPLEVHLADGQVWAPRNYDEQHHGEVSLLEALVNSYNVSSARLGLSVGLPRVAATVQALGVERPINPYPSMLLGAVDLSPLEVSQMYQTLAAGGYRAPLRAIRQVMDRNGQVLQRYPLEVEEAVDPGAAYLVTMALHEVTRRGTAQSLQGRLPDDLQTAGKTGTTDDLRDSWFAGFTGSHLAVTWVGRDDNQPTGLTGSTGALPVWADVIDAIPTRSLAPLRPETVTWALVDPQTGLAAERYCPSAEWVPFIIGSVPTETSPCAAGLGGSIKRWFRGLFE